MPFYKDILFFLFWATREPEKIAIVKKRARKCLLTARRSFSRCSLLVLVRLEVMWSFLLVTFEKKFFSSSVVRS